MTAICKHAYPSDLCGTCNPPRKARFFIAQPGTPVKPHSDQQWTKWEVGDHRGQDRICLTSCRRKAELIRDALEAFHAKAEGGEG